MTLTILRSVLLALALTAPAQADEPSGPVPHSPGKPYAAKNLPDRIVLTPGADAATEMAVAWRTDVAQATAEVELAPALDGPVLAQAATKLSGSTRKIDTENGPAHYHQMRFTGLKPATSYAYRVKGAAGYSEWLQFRTAAAGFAPFRFIYLGDTQNNILSYGSRVIRQAFHSTASPALVMHAGDLVSQRDDLVHDDEWGEWNQAGGFHYATVPQVPAPGNHEYVDVPLPDGEETKALGPHWPLQFALPDNGAAAAKPTSYFLDYQGVRFVILDGTAALELGALASQTEWLKSVLKDRKSRWTVVSFHQPIYTCARPKDTEMLKAAWAPVFEQYRVDLVLQGHDHCYSRLTSAQGKAVSAKRHKAGTAQGPVYVVSVTGSKMYALNDRAFKQPDRVAEDTELYQVIEVGAQRLDYTAYTASGRHYDSFSLTRGKDGRNRFVASKTVLPPIRQCVDGLGPDGFACTARAK